MAQNSPSPAYIKHCTALICLNMKFQLENSHCGNCARRITTSGHSNIRAETDGNFMQGELWLFC